MDQHNDIPEAALQELRMRQGEIALWRGKYRHTRSPGALGLWGDAECKLQGVMGVLIALYGTEAAVHALTPTDAKWSNHHDPD